MAKDQTEEQKTETTQPVEDGVQDTVQASQVRQPSRYVCEACSGIAFYSHLVPGVPSNCRNCGAAMSGLKDENFIALTQNEIDQLAAL